MKVLILTSIASNDFAYARGDQPTLSDADALRLINAGHAIRLIETSTILDDIETAALAANYTEMASATDAIPTPSGGFYWDARDRLHVVHPSGGKVVIDPLHLTPGWSP